MDKSFKETIVLNHSRYVEDYHLARLKVYELTPNLKYLLNHGQIYTELTILLTGILFLKDIYIN